MIGTWKWNAYVAVVAMVVTLITSLSNNEWTTSLLRSLYSFVILFAAVYAVRFVLGTAAGMKNFKETAPLVGQTVNLVTPADPAMPGPPGEQQSEQSEGEQFTPLAPKKLVSKENIDPQVLADSLRHMSEK